MRQIKQIIMCQTHIIASYFEGACPSVASFDLRRRVKLYHLGGVKLDSLFALRFALSSKRSFGLIEVLVSGIVMVTVIGASVSVRQRAGAESAVARHQAQAYLLAQEGIEAVRQIRDTNYLATQQAGDGTPKIKRPWTCDLTMSLKFNGDINGVFQTCDPTTNLYSNNQNTRNNFSPNNTNRSYDSLELGNGQTFGSIFRDESNINLPTLPLPTWHLSSRTNPLFDGGTSANTPATNMLADGCAGAERIFVRDGEGEPQVPPNSIVMQNRRIPGSDSKDTQENKRGFGASSPPDYCDIDRSKLTGYVEYRRQVFVTPRLNATSGNTINTNESPGNLPKTWSVAGNVSDISKHQIQVLVRVSWKEGRRPTVSDPTAVTEDFAVLLATYLSDWRQVN